MRDKESKEMAEFLEAWPEIKKRERLPQKWNTISKMCKLRNVEAQNRNRIVVKVWAHRNAVKLFRSNTEPLWLSDDPVETEL